MDTNAKPDAGDVSAAQAEAAAKARAGDTTGAAQAQDKVAALAEQVEVPTGGQAGQSHIRNVGPHEHAWATHERTPAGDYEACAICGARRYTGIGGATFGGYGAWLSGGEWPGEVSPVTQVATGRVQDPIVSPEAQVAAIVRGEAARAPTQGELEASGVDDAGKDAVLAQTGGKLAESHQGTANEVLGSVKVEAEGSDDGERKPRRQPRLS